MRIPLYIEMKGRNILVIGGGNVGTRRALKFLEAGANVKVVSKEFSPTLRETAEKEARLQLVQADASDPEELESLVEWAHIVVLATDNLELNRRISQLARRLGKLVNNATDASDTDIVVPFETEVDGIRVAVTTEGRAGVVARLATERIEEMLRNDKELRTLMEVMSRAKEYMKTVIGNPKKRFPIYFELADDEKLRSLAKQGRAEEAWIRAKEIIDSRAAEN